MTEQEPLLPMDAGSALKQERVQRSISVEDAAGALRIPVDLVEAIEADRLERFAPVYRRGYVRAYAHFLGFDAPRTERLLSGIEPDAPELHAVFPGLPRRSRADHWLKATSYVLASLLIGTLAWQFTHEAVRLSQGDPGLSPAQVAATVGGDNGDRAPPPATHVNASIAALEKMRQPVPAGARSAGEQAWSALQHAGEAATEAAGLPGGEHLLRLVTSADCWVEIVDAQGRQLELDLVRGGIEKNYGGAAPFSILLGRASAVELSLDGRTVDTGPFTSGDVTQMTLAGDPAADDTPDGDVQ
jgi:cytoskeleton protein RodZ